MGDEIRAMAALSGSSVGVRDAARFPDDARAEVLAPGGRLAARIEARGARLRRRLGIAGSREGLELSPDELRLVRIALADWARTRDSWASFRHSCAGFKPGTGGAWYFTPPGAGASRVRVALHAVGLGREGTPFRGVERTRPLEPARALAPGVIARAELRRTGEVETPPEGLRTGLVYAIGPGLVLEAWREEARLARGDSEVWLERGEEAFLDDLAREQRAPAA